MEAKKMTGKTCIVTGANSGIGKETAIGLARLGARVIIVCRNQKKGNDAKREIADAARNESVDLLLCNLASLTQVRSLAERILNQYNELRVLVNNAGIFSLRSSRTEDGLERTLAVNYFAPFLLTLLLLERLKSSTPSRIVNVSSVSHFGGRLNLNEIAENKGGRSMSAYSNSKLALVMFTYELDRRLRGTGVTVNCLHPGAVSTNIWRLPTILTRPFMISAKKGSQTSVYLASSEEVEGVSGKYYEKMGPRRSSEESYNQEEAKELWNVSLKLVGLST